MSGMFNRERKPKPSALMCACVCRRDVVLKLLQFEASTNVADNKGCFPLHLAAWRGDADIVRILTHHGPSHCRVNQQARLPHHQLLDTN